MAAYARLEDSAGPMPTVPDGPATILHGQSVGTDPRLARQLAREYFYLTVLTPKKVSMWTARQGLFAVCKFNRMLFISCTMLIYIVVVTSCALPGEAGDERAFSTIAIEVCRGGPLGSSKSEALTFEGYSPVLLNSCATLLLAFFCNVARADYGIGYEAVLALKESVLDLMVVCVGTISATPKEGINSVDFLLDVWRSINLVHLTTYSLADKARSVYSWHSFVLPIAFNYGPFDWMEKLGMFTRSEVRSYREGGRGRDAPPVRQGQLQTTARRAPTSELLPHARARTLRPPTPLCRRHRASQAFPG